MGKYTRISACGLDCSQCDLRLFPQDQLVQERILSWFRSMKWLEADERIETVIEKKMYCKGCSVDPDIFWSNNCQIAKCCKQDRHLENCSACGKFPCEMLVKWSGQNERYKNAYVYLLNNQDI